jgi:hypothetical protein
MAADVDDLIRATRCPSLGGSIRNLKRAVPPPLHCRREAARVFPWAPWLDIRDAGCARTACSSAFFQFRP